MLSFKTHISEFKLDKARAFMLELDWEHGNPNDQGADEWEAEGVFVHSWDRRKNKMIIAGTKPAIHRWLMFTYGLLKRSADIALKDAKPLR
tara:strand:- start:219 stop:491 length:273 start_codon:yes stop_codon:yes gene_type:complete